MLAELGAEGLARLRARYSNVMAAIARRVPDPQRREELKALAERLNPDLWITPEEVRTGLAGYEAAFDAFRGILSRRRRRRRNRPAEGEAGTGDEGNQSGQA